MKGKTPDTPRPGYWKTALYMILMGVLVWWLTFFAIPKAIGWEMDPATVNRIPFAGFGIGAALGLAMGVYERIRTFVWFVIGTIITGWLAWLFLLFIVALALSVGGLEGEAFDRAMERVSSIVFWLAVIAGGAAVAAGGCAIVYDKLDPLVERFRPKRRRSADTNGRGAP